VPVVEECPDCGSRPAEQHIVCASCGKALVPLSEADLWWCRTCGGGIRDVLSVRRVPTCHVGQDPYPSGQGETAITARGGQEGPRSRGR